MNSLKRNYELALEALEELTAELVTVDMIQEEEDETRPSLQLAPVSLKQTLDEFGTLPRNALFLGAAYDELPILLNLNDPTPGPILIAGDQGSGKRAFLQIVAQAISIMHRPEDVQFGVITSQPDKWEGFAETPNCMGVFPSDHKKADNFILSLADWAHHNHREQRFALLLIDDLEIMMGMNEDVQQSLRWLLLRGPNRRVWTFATLNARKSKRMLPWLEAFRTRLFGAVKNAHDTEAILPTRGADLHLLEAGIEFILNENRQWVKFWIPSIDPISK